MRKVKLEFLLLGSDFDPAWRRRYFLPSRDIIIFATFSFLIVDGKVASSDFVYQTSHIRRGRTRWLLDLIKNLVFFLYQTSDIRLYRIRFMARQ